MTMKFTCLVCGFCGEVPYEAPRLCPRCVELGADESDIETREFDPAEGLSATVSLADNLRGE